MEIAWLMTHILVNLIFTRIGVCNLGKMSIVYLAENDSLNTLLIRAARLKIGE